MFIFRRVLSIFLIYFGLICLGIGIHLIMAGIAVLLGFRVGYDELFFFFLGFISGTFGYFLYQQGKKLQNSNRLGG